MGLAFARFLFVCLSDGKHEAYIHHCWKNATRLLDAATDIT